MPPLPTAVPREGSKKAGLAGYLRERRPASIGGREWRELLVRLAPVSESYLRKLVDQSGIPFEQPYAGVRQASFGALEKSLVEMQEAYSAALAEGDRERAQYARSAMIQAKDHARLAARSSRVPPGKRAEKAEMVEWMLVWLDNPEVFPEWARLRRKATGIQ
ncbi:MAG: hypothetical protein FJW37_01820 [Acidobacteria bacterium]|nr:hypothetical protein [Acidobacteriota bacterium]